MMVLPEIYSRSQHLSVLPLYQKNDEESKGSLFSLVSPYLSTLLFSIKRPILFRTIAFIGAGSALYSFMELTKIQFGTIGLAVVSILLFSRYKGANRETTLRQSCQLRLVFDSFTPQDPIFVKQIQIRLPHRLPIVALIGKNSAQSIPLFQLEKGQVSILQITHQELKRLKMLAVFVDDKTKKEKIKTIPLEKSPSSSTKGSDFQIGLELSKSNLRAYLIETN